MFDKNLIVALVAVVILGGYMFFEQNIRTTKVPEQMTKYSEGQLVEVTGKMTCLSHAVKGVLQTMECAVGIVDKDGIEYGLLDKDNKFYSQLAQDGKEKTVKGVFRKVENKNYLSKGSIEVTEVK